MKKVIIAFVTLTLCGIAAAQPKPLKPRPDAFPPVEETKSAKSVEMATTPAEMADWDRYPTYSTYVTMMQQWATNYPSLCRLDTIGTSVQGRLILSMELTANPTDTTLPEFFYSSTIHGDEVTGYVMMLRLIDTLLRGYGNNPQYTSLTNTTLICINPLANPDGTYIRSNNNISRASRYNANGVDLNRNYPDPFAAAKEQLQPENAAMISYFDRHNFRLSANLHGGAEVMNYPWDSFTSTQNPHPESAWWQDVCRRFVDTSRTYNPNHFYDTYACGYTAGGDWYVIDGGRQDYFNYYYNCLELTMELSTDKTLSTSQLPTYWNFLQHSLVNYIAEIHALVPPPVVITEYTITAHSDDTTMGYVEGSGIYTEDSMATLTAYALEGYLFSHWMDGDSTNPRFVTVTSDSTFTAYFVHEESGDTMSVEYTITALSDDSTMGYVEGSGIYTEDSTATLTAYALEGYLFSHWMDGDSTNPRFVTVTSDSTFTAYFVQEESGDTVGIATNESHDIVKVYVQNGCITVENTNLPVHIFDIMGHRAEPCNPRRGVYLVKIGNLPIRKLIVM